MRVRPDLLDRDSPADLEVIQLTDERDVPSSHIYMEAQIFTPDSKRFLLHRGATAHGWSAATPDRQYMVCDIEQDCELRPITDEPGAVAPSVTPDGKKVYYFLDQTRPGGGRLTLRCVNLDGTDRRTVMVIDSPLPGTDVRPSRLYTLSTISSDGNRLALSAFLGDGHGENVDWGLMIFDLPSATVQLVLRGPTWRNMHGQYCRSRDPAASHDILIQENHDCICDLTGEVAGNIGERGVDVHVIRDDGTDFRTMPWGRDGNEFVRGHQCWRGRDTSAVSVNRIGPLVAPVHAELDAGWAVADAGHLGRNTPGARSNRLSRGFDQPGFSHAGTDAEGRWLVTDCEPMNAGGRIFLARLPDEDGEPIRQWTYLMSPGFSDSPTCDIHPFLSPDGRMAFFNSDEGGIQQAYMIRNLDIG